MPGDDRQRLPPYLVAVAGHVVPVTATQQGDMIIAQQAQTGAAGGKKH